MTLPITLMSEAPMGPNKQENSEGGNSLEEIVNSKIFGHFISSGFGQYIVHIFKRHK
jgi:hypothetical protein